MRKSISSRVLIVPFLVAVAAACMTLAWGAEPPDAPPFTGCDGREITREAGDWTVMATGDIVATTDERRNTTTFDGFAPLFKSAEFVIGNLEGAITDHDKPRKRVVPGRSYVFRFPPSFAKVLKAANVDVLSIANNHSYDYGNVGFSDTVMHLQAAGAKATGLPGTYVIREVGAVKVAIVGLAHYPAFNNVLDPGQAATLVSRLKAEADVVILSYQLGAEGEPAARLPSGPEVFLGEARGDARAFARKMAEAGATVLVGHGPHVVRAAECINNVPVFHSVGNFVSVGGLSVAGLASAAVVPEFLFGQGGALRGVRAWPVDLWTTKLPLLDATGRGVHLVNALGRDAVRNHPDFKPLFLRGYETRDGAFRAWLRTTSLGRVAPDP